MVKLRCLILKINPKEPFMSIVNTLALESNRQIKINFDGGDFSSDVGLLTELYQVCVLNPIKTCQMRKNNVRKTKTNKVDTYVIAQTLMMQDNLRFVSFFNLDMMDLKALEHFRQKIIKQRTRLKIQLTTYVDQVFSEIQYFF